eukprot:TRINITY_DN2932_c0_g1_i1.p1 TRINITY_DN2932_c0_g1~~TRINITY_DN2932_c0_g1_i1.p1  ORF type:complete len:1010 (+),score=251.89 TRINITY_DN2932_c0_g1_i1:444-3473(+)
MELNYLSDLNKFDQIFLDQLNCSKYENGVLGLVEAFRKKLNEYSLSTPQWHNFLFCDEIGYSFEIKFDNLQKMADILIRAYSAIILGESMINNEELKGIVLVLNDDMSRLHTAEIAVVSDFLEIPCHIFCPTNIDFVSLHQVTIAAQLENVELHAVDSNILDVAVHSFCITNSFHRIENSKIPFYATLGLMTCAAEIATTNPDVVIVPIRGSSPSWSTYFAFSYYFQHLDQKPEVILTHMETLPQFNVWDDGLGISVWLLNRLPESSPAGVFLTLDVDQSGWLEQTDVDTYVCELFKNEKMTVTWPGGSLSPSQFVNLIIEQKNLISSAVANSLISWGNKDLLLSVGWISQIVSISNNDTLAAWIKCLYYTHSHTTLSSATSLAVLFTNRLPNHRNKRIVSVLTGGTVDIEHFQELLGRALELIGQKGDIVCHTVPDAAVMAQIFDVLASEGLNVLDSRKVPSQRSPNHIKVIFTVFGLDRTAINRSVDELKKFTLHSYSNDVSRFSPPLQPNIKYDVDKSKVEPFTNFHRDVCDISLESIAMARDRISKNLYDVPIYKSSIYSREKNADVIFMLENIQQTGAFKIRGSSNCIMVNAEKNSKIPGIIASSAGNHAQGVAYAAKSLHIPCTIVCPTYAPDTKLSNTRRYNAEVIKYGSSFGEAAAFANELAEKRGWMKVHPFQDPLVFEGQGTIAHDLYNAYSEFDTVVVNVGGGGMISGIALYLRKLEKKIGRKFRIIGVQAGNVAPLCGDFTKTGNLDYYPPKELTLADGINVKLPGGPYHSAILYHLIDEFVAVPENEIASMITHTLCRTCTLTEGAGAVGLAVLHYDHIKTKPGEKVAVILCGGNIDLSHVMTTYPLGIRTMGRAFTIEVEVGDTRGQLGTLLDIAKKFCLSVVDINHVRTMDHCLWNKVNIQLTCYSVNFRAQVGYLCALLEAGYDPRVMGRRHIANHEVIYAPFDQKREEMMKSHKLQLEEEMEHFRIQDKKLFDQNSPLPDELKFLEELSVRK